MKLIVDAMGGDHAPLEIVKGCVDAVNEYDIDLTLVGDSSTIKSELERLSAPMERFEIVHTTEVISMDDVPVTAIKQKKDSSMVVGLSMVREDENNVFISAGNTGALMAGGLLKVGRIKGILRPALAPILPNINTGTLLIDAGANADCKPENLLQFGIMGSIYMERVLGKKNPTVGLINIGEENTKGNDLSKEAYKLLRESKHITFAGNIEAREVPKGVVDVLVCDGFTGNILLKYTEGLGLSLFSLLKEELTKTYTRKLGALLLKPGLKNFKKLMDYAEQGGAPLLGINGGIIKAHGSSNAKAIKNAIRQGKLFRDNEVLQKIKGSVVDNKEN